MAIKNMNNFYDPRKRKKTPDASFEEIQGEVYGSQMENKSFVEEEDVRGIEQPSLSATQENFEVESEKRNENIEDNNQEEKNTEKTRDVDSWARVYQERIKAVKGGENSVEGKEKEASTPENKIEYKNRNYISIEPSGEENARTKYDSRSPDDILEQATKKYLQENKVVKNIKESREPKEGESKGKFVPENKTSKAGSKNRVFKNVNYTEQKKKEEIKKEESIPEKVPSKNIQASKSEISESQSTREKETVNKEENIDKAKQNIKSEGSEKGTGKGTNGNLSPKALNALKKRRQMDSQNGMNSENSGSKKDEDKRAVKNPAKDKIKKEISSSSANKRGEKVNGDTASKKGLKPEQATILRELLDDYDVTEIIITNYDNIRFKDFNGELFIRDGSGYVDYDSFYRDVRALIQENEISARWDKMFFNGKLKDGSDMTVFNKKDSSGEKRISVRIRKEIKPRNFNFSDLKSMGIQTEQMERSEIRALEAQKSIVVYGENSNDNLSIMGAIAKRIPSDTMGAYINFGSDLQIEKENIENFSLDASQIPELLELTTMLSRTGTQWFIFDEVDEQSVFNVTLLMDGEDEKASVIFILNTDNIQNPVGYMNLESEDEEIVSNVILNDSYIGAYVHVGRDSNRKIVIDSVKSKINTN